MPDLDLKLVDDKSWNDLHIDPGRIDAGIRLVASLIDVGDGEQLFRRTGMRLEDDGTIKAPNLPLFLETPRGSTAAVLTVLASIDIAKEQEKQGISLSFAPAYIAEAERNERVTVVPARLGWSRKLGFRDAIKRLLDLPGIQRLALPNPLQPCLEQSLADMELPVGRTARAAKLTGKKVIVGIIDDGCALAHQHFLVPGTLQSRILSFWDQNAAPPAGSAYWSAPGGFTYGRELTKANIDAVLAACAGGGRLDEDLVYQTLDYELDIGAHGTHVMDIAAGNGSSLMGQPGVATEADIIFVQLPRDQVEQGGIVLEDHILEGVKYVFDRAKNQQAVVNISFGGYCGPHDGTSRLAAGMDELLDKQPGRAVVVSAGNGFEADCHAQGKLRKGAKSSELVWLLQPEDPTSNHLEVWYEGDTELLLELKGPGGGWIGPVGMDEWKAITRTSDNAVIGWIQHQNNGAPGKGSNYIRINLASTVGEDTSVPTPAAATQVVGGTPPPIAAPAPSGAWSLRLENAGQSTANFHAWIERDDMPRRRGRRGQQARFQDADSNPWSTVADLGTGEFVICVGAHNTHTGEMCRYSACGPTRNGKDRPDLTAPAEETGLGGGVLSASARRARPTRMGGTSAAAPHVAGLVALIMEATPGLKADKIRKKLVEGARKAGKKAWPPPPPREIRHSARQEIDPRRAGKRQSDHFDKVIGAGKANAPESI